MSSTYELLCVIIFVIIIRLYIQLFIICNRSQNSPNPADNSARFKGVTYLVFESALLMLFATCKFCSSASVDIKRSLNGSLLRIKQYCGRCKQMWCWDSQPFIGNIPAGNILTSAAILYSGSLPTKALRIFQILKCPSISTTTFFRHQNKYLQPVIEQTWSKYQSSLLQSISSQSWNLFLSGDGRADSPGHSAKFGSYTVIDVFCNKVVDFKLVQVSVWQLIIGIYTLTGHIDLFFCAEQ